MKKSAPKKLKPPSREDEVLRRMLNTPPEKHQTNKAKREIARATPRDANQKSKGS